MPVPRIYNEIAKNNYTSITERETERERERERRRVRKKEREGGRKRERERERGRGLTIKAHRAHLSAAVHYARKCRRLDDIINIELFKGIEGESVSCMFRFF